MASVQASYQYMAARSASMAAGSLAMTLKIFLHLETWRPDFLLVETQARVDFRLACIRLSRTCARWARKFSTEGCRNFRSPPHTIGQGHSTCWLQALEAPGWLRSGLLLPWQPI